MIDLVAPYCMTHTVCTSQKIDTELSPPHRMQMQIQNKTPPGTVAKKQGSSCSLSAIQVTKKKEIIDPRDKGQN